MGSRELYTMIKIWNQCNESTAQKTCLCVCTWELNIKMKEIKRNFLELESSSRGQERTYTTFVDDVKWGRVKEDFYSLNLCGLHELFVSDLLVGKMKPIFGHKIRDFF